VRLDRRTLAAWHARPAWDPVGAPGARDTGSRPGADLVALIDADDVCGREARRAVAALDGREGVACFSRAASRRSRPAPGALGGAAGGLLG